MPELPEVETTLRTITPFLTGQTILHITTRTHSLRQPIPETLSSCVNQKITSLVRRGKFIILYLEEGALLFHLGMSGHLLITTKDKVVKKHDHVDILLGNGFLLRLNDPRRFGLFTHLSGDPLNSSHLRNLGPEPLSNAFSGEYIFCLSRHRKQALKSFIMDSRKVVGVGNIYATESLFLAGLHPAMEAGKLTLPQCDKLCEIIKTVLTQAIQVGGTTLKDFVSGEGKPGYFSQLLHIYGKEGQNCPFCNNIINKIILAGRSSTFCARCQSL
jgi:formamidopyrimidine-DNA glycosylase